MNMAGSAARAELQELTPDELKELHELAAMAPAIREVIEKAGKLFTGCPVARHVLDLDE